jgi:hypothetical protein
MITKTTRALTTTEFVALAAKVAAGAKLTKTQMDAVSLTIKTNDAVLLLDATDILLDAIAASV